MAPAVKLALLALAVSTVALLQSDGCGFRPPAGKAEGEPCTRTTECLSGLECRGGVCRTSRADSGGPDSGGTDGGSIGLDGSSGLDAGGEDAGSQPDASGADAASEPDASGAGAGAEPDASGP